MLKPVHLHFNKDNFKPVWFLSGYLLFFIGYLPLTIASTGEGSRQQKADSLFLLGTTLVHQEEFDQAKAFFLQAGSEFLENLDSLSCFTCLIRATEASYRNRHLKQGDSLFKRSEFLLNEMNTVVGDTLWVDFLNLKAYSYLLSGKLDSSRFTYLESVRIRDRLPLEDNGLSVACNNLGYIYNLEGDYSRAARFFSRAIKIKEKTLPQNDPILASTYSNYSGLLIKLARYKEATKYLEKAERSFRTNGLTNTPLLGQVYNNMGILFFNTGDYEKALNYYRQALRLLLLDPLRYKNVIPNIYNNLGLIYTRRNDYETALSWFNRNIEINKGIHPEKLSQTYLKIADLYRNMGKSEEAILYARRAIDDLLEHYGNSYPVLAVAYQNLGQYYLDRKGFKKSMISFRNALNLYRYYYGYKHPGTALCLQNMAKVYSSAGLADSALYYVQQSLIANVPDFNREELSFNPDPEEGALSDLRLISSLKLKSRLLLGRSKRFPADTTSLTLAFFTLETAVKVLGNLRLTYTTQESKLFLEQNESRIYEGSLQLALLLYKNTGNKEFMNKAFELAEKGKAAVLLSSVRGSEAMNFGGIPEELTRLEKRFSSDLTVYKENLYEEKKLTKPDTARINLYEHYVFDLSRKHDSLLKIFEEKYPEYYDLKYRSGVISPEKLAGSLANNQVVIEYTLTDTSLVTFLIGKNLFSMQEQKIEPLFYTQIKTLQDNITQNNFSKNVRMNFATFKMVSYSLYSKLIRPFENEIQEKDLIIIPDARLSYLPFGVLLTHLPLGDETDYHSLPYLIRTHAVGYSYSGTLLVNNLKRSGQGHKLIAFAPTYGSPDRFESPAVSRQSYRNELLPLLYNVQEAEEVGKLVNGKVVTGKLATETAFKIDAPSYDILHMAMHTLIDNENPMYSKLAFSFTPGDSLNDGFLNLSEIYNLRLKARLTVLSACSSGSGRFLKGEGVMSLARGFMYAGCPGIVMTLWEVEDRSGADIMRSFYAYLKQGYPKNKALQKAKIYYLDHQGALRSHPYFWSAYIDIGDPGPIYRSPWLIRGVISLLLVIGFIGLALYKRKRKFEKLMG